MNKINLLNLAGILTLLVVALHIACMIFGGDWYRFLGAGEQMALMSERGEAHPTIVTGVISFILLIWAAFAFSGAGTIIKLPLSKLALILITMIFLFRAFGFYFIMPAFPENSMTFWIVSSSICLCLGLTYAFGLKQRWHLIGK